jgi:tetratricopeptide (TPR) repeat protein
MGALVANPRYLDLEAWTLRRKLQRLLSADRLQEALRKPQEVARIVALLPSGVAAEAVTLARTVNEADQIVEGDEAFWDAAEAEVTLRRGDPAEASRLARQALEKLPKPLKPRRARAAAVAGEAAYQQGEKEEALRFLEIALRDDPLVFRALGLAVPIRCEHDGNPSTSQLTKLLADSPRFRLDPAGFPLQLTIEEGRLNMLFLFSAGVRHRVESVEVKEEPQETARAAALALHRVLFTPSHDLQPAELATLNRSATASSLSNDVDNIMNVVKPGEKK